MSEYHDEDGFTCHALVGGTVPMRIDTRYHALLALKRRTKQDISNEECMAELKSFFEKPVMTGVLERTPITHFAAIYDEESHLCYFTRINKKSIFVGTVLKKREDKILVHPDDERFIIRKNGKMMMGYSNPYTSATGLNFLLSALSSGGNDNIVDTAAVENFQKFQANVPLVSFTTQQMVQSADKGVVDGLVMEYQSYQNDPTLQRNIQKQRKPRIHPGIRDAGVS